jgi:hypothetical protein
VFRLSYRNDKNYNFRRGPNGPFVDVEALGEEGKAAIPAPLLRVRTGTVIAATVRNACPTPRRMGAANVGD